MDLKKFFGLLIIFTITSLLFVNIALADTGAPGYSVIATYKTPLYQIEVSNIHINNMGYPYGSKPHQNIVVKTLAGWVEVFNVHIWSERCIKGKAQPDVVYFESHSGFNGRICMSNPDDMRREVQTRLNQITAGLGKVLSDLKLAALYASLVAAIAAIAAWIVSNLWIFAFAIA